jgi:hypothetical protein
MRFDAHFGDAEAVQLKAAILLYGGARRVSLPGTCSAGDGTSDGFIGR